MKKISKSKGSRLRSIAVTRRSCSLMPLSCSKAFPAVVVACEHSYIYIYIICMYMYKNDAESVTKVNPDTGCIAALLETGESPLEVVAELQNGAGTVVFNDRLL